MKQVSVINQKKERSEEYIGWLNKRHEIEWEHRRRQQLKQQQPLFYERERSQGLTMVT